MKKYIIFLLLIVGCASKSNKATIKISLKDSNSLKITGIANDILQEINRDSATTAVWQSLIPVYRMPKDTDLKDYQPPQPGKYVVTYSSVLFTPDTPFIKQQLYFLRFYQYGEGNSIMEYVKRQKKLGHVAYMDLIFKQ
jgi:hypothetical protein